MPALRKLTSSMELETTKFVDGIEVVKKKTIEVTNLTEKNLAQVTAAYTKAGAKNVKTQENTIATTKMVLNEEARAYKKAERVLNNYAAEVKLAGDMAGKTALEQEILTRQLMLGSGATDAQKQAMAELVTQEHLLAEQSKKTGHNFRAMRNATSQLQYQIQDIAIQAQMGTNAFTILGQQGSQIAMLFGTGGAVVGSIIAVGAALSGVLFKAITGSSDQIKDYIVDVKKLSSELDSVAKLTKNQLSLAYLETSKSLNELVKDQERHGKVIANLNQQLDAGVSITRNQTATGRILVETRKLTRKEINKLRLELAEEHANLDLVNAAYKVQSELLVEINNKRRGLATAKQKKETKELIDSLQLEVNTYGLSEKAIALYEAATRKATEVDLKRIAVLYDQLDALKDKTEKEKENADSVTTSAENLANLGEEVNLLYMSTEAQEEYRREKAASLSIYSVETKALLKLRDAKLADIKADEERKELLSRLTNEGKLEALKKQYDEERKLLVGHNEALKALDEQYSNDRIKISGSAWEKYAVTAKENLLEFDSLVENSLDRFTSGFGNAFTNAIFESESFGDAFKNLFVDVGKSMVSFFAEWAAQKLMIWALDKTLNASANVAKATTMTADAQAMSFQAGLNAYASAAATPVIGHIIAPAAMAQALAVTQPLAGAVSAFAYSGAYDKGGKIPSGSAGVVSEFGHELVGGTLVYNGSPNSLSVTGREDTARLLGSGNNSFTINSYGAASPEAIARATVRMLKKGSKSVDNAVFDSMNRGKRNRGKRFA